MRTPLKHGVHEGIAYYDSGELPSKSPGYTVVLAHGYGLGSGIWAHNIDDIVAIQGVSRVVAFDWLGMGASDRPQPGKRIWNNTHLLARRPHGSHSTHPHNNQHPRKLPIRKFYHIDPPRLDTASTTAAATLSLASLAQSDDATHHEHDPEPENKAINSQTHRLSGEETRSNGKICHGFFARVKRTTKSWVNTLLCRSPTDNNVEGKEAERPSSVKSSASATASAVTSLGTVARVKASAFVTKCVSARSSSVDEAVNFFLHSLPSLYARLQLRNTILVGHSLGGYLSVQFAHRYPDLNAALILASPAGVTAGQASKELREQLLTNPVTAPRMLRLLDALWRFNFTPQHIIRFAGAKRGRRLALRLARRVFGNTIDMHDESVNALVDYLYHITAAPASGEYALSALLFLNAYSETDIVSETHVRDAETGVRWSVHAREPVNEKLISLTTLPIHFIYGEHDWLYLSTVPSLIEAMRRERQRVNGSPNGVALTVLPDAGHHLYSNNPKGFAKAIESTVRSLPPPAPASSLVYLDKDVFFSPKGISNQFGFPYQVPPGGSNGAFSTSSSNPPLRPTLGSTPYVSSFSRGASTSGSKPLRVIHTFSTISPQTNLCTTNAAVSDLSSEASSTFCGANFPKANIGKMELSRDELPRGNLLKPQCPFARFLKTSR